VRSSGDADARSAVIVDNVAPIDSFDADTGTGGHVDTNTTLEVDRSAVRETRLVTNELAPLQDGQVRLRIDRFAVTANNITYAVFGDMLGYWDFFPTGEAGWGRVPAMGWADVVESGHADIADGRYYGWFPMSRYIDLAASATSRGLRDDGAHRSGHASVYRSYADTRLDPWYPNDIDEDARGEAEDRHALLRGLFGTAFLADEFFADADYFGASAAIVLSASSKTAIGFAQRAAERGIGQVIGLTSASNADFVRSLGWYDHVFTYDDIASLPPSDAVSIDMAGNAAALAAVHERLGDHLRYSMIVGNSHHDSPLAEITTGPAPEFFFAPSEVTRREQAWGVEDYQTRLADALATFIDGSHRWLTVQRVAGAATAESTWHEVYDGELPPSIGRIVSLHD
jgi:hypothetical protein